MNTNSTRFCKTESDIIMVLLKVCFLRLRTSMPCFNFGGRGNKTAAVCLSLNLSIIFDPCLHLQRSSGCAARRAPEGAPYRRCPQTTATHHPRVNGQHTPSYPLPRALRLGQNRDTARRHWVPSDGRVLERAPSPAPGTHPSLSWEESGSWSLHEPGCCFSTAGRSKTSLNPFFLSVTVTLEAFIILKFRPFVQT